MKYVLIFMALVLIGCSVPTPNDTIVVVDREAYYSFFKSCVYDSPNFEGMVMSTDRSSALDRMVASCREAAIEHNTFTTTHAEVAKHPTWISRYNSGL